MRIPRRAVHRLAVQALAAGGMAALLPRLAQAQAGEQQRLIDEARIIAESFVDDPEAGKMRVYVQNAYGVLIVPDLLRAGLLVGGQYGNGVMLSRDPQTGLWSEPAFFRVYGGSFGLQVGGQAMDTVFTIMNQGALAKLLSSRFKLGADASGALGPMGGGVGAATTLNFGEDVYVFSRNKGLYGGISLAGTVFAPRDDWSQAYYGQSLTADQIVRQRTLPNQAGTAALRNTLARF